MIVLDWPIPPSNNNLTRSHGRRGKPSYHPTPAYERWKRAADKLSFAQKPRGGWVRIMGHYELRITIDRARFRANADLANIEKGCSDHLKRTGIIEDDKKAIRIIMEFGEAPEGCRVVVTPQP